MKKLLLTTIAAATVATAGLGGQAQAAEKEYKVHTEVHAIQLGQFDQEKIQSLIDKICASYPSDKIGEALRVTLPNFQLPENVTYPVPVEKETPKAPETMKPAPEAPKAPETAKPAPEVSKKPETMKPAPEAPKAPETSKPAPEAPKAPEATTPAPAPTEQPSKEQKPEQQVSGVTQEEQQMIDLVNQERSKQGLAPLKVNLELTKVARVKAQDMINKNYFDHQSPTYGSPFDMLNQFGIQYRTAGENLAGNQTVEAAHKALMNSQGHRENILNSNYQEVGIGIVDGGPYGKMFVQLFKG
ncbi:hypothetical protein GN156_02690 [bacterium LRH843]|nr:hypothetical protein [bacterium LRH843]